MYAADGLGRANWSFDFAYAVNTTACSTCRAFLRIDTDPSALANVVDIDLTALYGNSRADSWNMTMGFLAPIGFNAFAASSTDFTLFIRDTLGSQTPVLSSAITVKVPEPGSLALAGLALLGLFAARRRNA